METLEEANTAYQKTILDKEELLRVLGDEGEFVIKKTDGTEIKKINKQNVNQKEKIITINYEEPQKEIIMEINQAKKTGTINIMHQKVILPEYKQRSEVKELEKLVTIGNLKQTNQIKEKEEKIKTNLQETTTKAEVKINNRRLIAGKTNENVEIKTTLLTNENKYDLYKNPSIEVEFPEEVQKVAIKNVSLLYGEGLVKEKQEIYQNEEGKIVAKVSLAGEQAKYTKTDLVKGANVILSCDITVNAIEQNEKQEIQVKYTNNQDNVQYENEGICKAEVNYIVTEETKLQNKYNETMKTNETQQAEAPITVTKTIAVGEGNNIYEGQVQKYTIKIKNNTNQEINGITVKDEIPEELTYVIAHTRNGFMNQYKDVKDQKTFEINVHYQEEDEDEEEKEDPDEPEEEDPTDPQDNQLLEPNGEIQIIYYARVKKDEKNIGKEVGTKAQVIINGNDTIYETNEVKNTIKKGNMQVDMITSANTSVQYERTSSIRYQIKIKNITGEKLTGVTAINQIPDDTSYMQAGKMTYDQEEDYYYVDNDDENQKIASYDENSKTVTWKVGELAPGEEKRIYVIIKLEGTKETVQNIPNQVTVQADNVEPSYSNIEEIKQAPVAKFTITKETNLQDKYVYEEEEFEYILTIKNTGKREINGIISDQLPEGIILKEIITNIKGKEEKIEASYVNVPCDLEVGEEMTVRILVQADNLPNGVNELEVKNKATVENETDTEETSNEVITIIKRDPNKQDQDTDENGEPNNPSGEEEQNNIYNISGIAWIDENQNGAKDDQEKTIQGVPVKLYDADGKAVKDSGGNEICTVTGSEGKYILPNIEKGDYIVVFEYDNRAYTLTEYQKTGVAQEKNSDVTATTVKGKTVATTDILSVYNQDIENINMGVIKSEVFDLKLDKYISNITVQNGNTTKEYSYNNANFAKIEVDRKTVNNTSVTIEYKISITNEGEIEGYAEEIVDYIPEDLEFNPNQNEDWEVEDGKLITTALAEETINPKETKTINLVLTKHLTEDNLGTVINTAEIKEDYNENLVGDIDSTPNNKKAGEDDMATASVIIGLNTGRIIMYISLIVTTIVILLIGTYLIKKKVIKE